MLSRAAVARLARGLGDPDVAMPDLQDFPAVRAWRSRVNAGWGEGTEGDEPAHVRATIAGVPVLVAGPSTGPLSVVYLHGGTYVLGSPAVAAPITARLARRLRVISVDYRLAPEHRYPAALEDAEAVFRAVRAASERPVALAGDSAGGALALGVTFRLAQAGEQPPLGVVALCPHLQHRAPGQHDAGSDAHQAVALADSYLGQHSPADPVASPLRAPATWLSALPPTLVQAGTLDPLWRSQAHFARRARAAGAAVTLDVWDGMWHAWQYHRRLPESDQAMAEAVHFLENLSR
ncbi:MAG: alpha/beta hydrolase [Acidimicrobiales bacterium]